MYDIRSAMLNIGIVFTPGKFKINLEKTWKTPGILVNLRSTDPGLSKGFFDKTLHIVDKINIENNTSIKRLRPHTACKIIAFQDFLSFSFFGLII